MTDLGKQRFETLLHAYELGLLSDEEEEEFELLILENPSFFQVIRDGEAQMRVLRESHKAPGLVEDSLRQWSMDTADEGPRHATAHGRKQFWLAPAVAIAALLVLLLFDWRVEIEPGSPAVAIENRLLVTYFSASDASLEEERIREIVTDLIITDLSESHHLHVVSVPRLNDLMDHAGYKRERHLTASDITTLGLQARAAWTLTGTVVQAQPNIILTAGLIDAGSGDLIHAFRAEAQQGETIFTVVDRLSASVREALLRPEDTRTEQDLAVEAVTTRSPEAYRHYLQGIEYYQKVYIEDAVRSFRLALDYDSTFAMAYYYLAVLGQEQSLAKAVEYAPNASRKDQILIHVLRAATLRQDSLVVSELKTAMEEYPDERRFPADLGIQLYRQGRNQEAIEYLQRALALDSLYGFAYNILSYAYSAMGNLDEAIAANDRYIALAPEEANPYDSRGEIYAQNGRINEAIEFYSIALELKPDLFNTAARLGHIYLFQGRYAEAEQHYRRLLRSGDPSMRSEARQNFSLISCTKGQFARALEQLSTGIMMDSLDYTSYGTGGLASDWADKLMLRSNIYAALKNWGDALGDLCRAAEVVSMRDENERFRYHWLYAYRLAQSGRFTDAAKTMEELRLISEEGGIPRSQYLCAKGLVALEQGQTSDAVTLLESAAKEADEFYVAFMLGRAYLSASQFDSAIDLYQKELSRYDLVWRRLFPIWRLEIHYCLGLAYEGTGDHRRAAEEYREFLDAWKDADRGIPVLEDAELRMHALEAGS